MLEEFWSSEENQKKYGFEYVADATGFNKIIYDGDLDDLMTAALTTMGFFISDSQEVDEEPIQIINFGVDGIGDLPNFYVQLSADQALRIRFNLIDPEYYPADYICPLKITNKTLTEVNRILRTNYAELVCKWNSLRPDCTMEPQPMLPNYRAINRIR